VPSCVESSEAHPLDRPTLRYSALAAEVLMRTAVEWNVMPKMNGIEVASPVHKVARPPKVIILSMHADESSILRALVAGAKAYLLKDAADEDLLPALRAVSAGKPFFSAASTAVLIEDYVRQLRDRGLTDTYHLLTDREREVLQLLAEGRSNKEVAVLLDVGVSKASAVRQDAYLVDVWEL